MRYAISYAKDVKLLANSVVKPQVSNILAGNQCLVKLMESSCYLGKASIDVNATAGLIEKATAVIFTTGRL